MITTFITLISIISTSLAYHLKKQAKKDPTRRRFYSCLSFNGLFFTLYMEVVNKNPFLAEEAPYLIQGYPFVILVAVLAMAIHLLSIPLGWKKPVTVK